MAIFSNSYRFKRLASLVFSNSQSLRWVTEGKVLARLWRGRVSPADRCLDVGCGGGSYAIENFLRAGAQADLSDFDEGLLALARQQVAQAGYADRAGFQHASAEALPYRDGTFECVQCIQVLEHLGNPGKALAEFRRVTKPGATLVTAVPHPPEWFHNPDHVVEGYTADDFAALLGRAGWESDAVEPCMLLFSRLVISALHWTRVPLPLNFLAALETLVPRALAWHCLPYVVVIRARRVDNFLTGDAAASATMQMAGGDQPQPAPAGA